MKQELASLENLEDVIIKLKEYKGRREGEIEENEKKKLWYPVRIPVGARTVVDEDVHGFPQTAERTPSLVIECFPC